MSSKEIKESEDLSSLQEERNQRLAQVCEHIWAASGILRTFDSEELQKVAWLLEDTITYIDEALTIDDARPIEKIDHEVEESNAKEAEPISS